MDNFGYADIRPDKIENKQLRQYYFRLAWIVIALVAVFSGLNTAVMNIAAGIMGGGFSGEQLITGKEILRSSPEMSAIYSYGFPLIADIAAFGVGLLITRADIRSKFKGAGMSGKGFLCMTAVTFSTATVAAFVNILLVVLIFIAAGGLSNFDMERISSAADVSTAGNPLWLDILIYLYICLIGPVMEELIFRGVLLEGLRKYGNAFGIIMSAVLFGLMHQNFMQCIPAAAIGIIWGYAAVKSGSLIPSVILHILNNSMSAVLMVLLDNVKMPGAGLDVNSIEDMTSLPEGYMAVFAASGLLLLFRLVCIIASIVIAVRFFSPGHPRLVETSEYSKKRTWKYFFTSLPWAAAVLYLIYGTVTSIPLHA